MDDLFKMKVKCKKIPSRKTNKIMITNGDQ